MNTALTLFGICPLCHLPSDQDGLACPGCVTAARGLIRHADGAPATDDELAAVLGGQPAPELPAAPAPPTAPPAPAPEREWKRGQWCWAGDHRTTCTPDPQFPDLWVCRDHYPEEPCG